MDRLYTTRQIADRFGFTVSQMIKWRERKQGPLCRRVVGRWYYRLADVSRWLDEQGRQSKAV